MLFLHSPLVVIWFCGAMVMSRLTSMPGLKRLEPAVWKEVINFNLRFMGLHEQQVK